MLLVGCGPSQRLLVQKYPHPDYSVKKLVLLDPVFINESLAQLEQEAQTEAQMNLILETERKAREGFAQAIAGLAARASVQVQTLDHDHIGQVGSLYFSDVAPLEHAIVRAMAQQDPSRYARATRRGASTAVLLSYPPQIGPDYCQLAQHYDTPYFGLMGYLDGRRADQYFLVVADVRSGALLHLEMRALRGRVSSERFTATIASSLQLLEAGWQRP